MYKKFVRNAAKLRKECYKVLDTFRQTNHVMQSMYYKGAIGFPVLNDEQYVELVLIDQLGWAFVTFKGHAIDADEVELEFLCKAVDDVIDITKG